jgi:hypothetical protein
MLLTNYQITEILIGTCLFPMAYFLYLYFTESEISYFDIGYCTLVIFIIMTFKDFYINFNILQAQNAGSQYIVNGMY